MSTEADMVLGFGPPELEEALEPSNGQYRYTAVLRWEWYVAAAIFHKNKPWHTKREALVPNRNGVHAARVSAMNYFLGRSA